MAFTPPPLDSLEEDPAIAAPAGAPVRSSSIGKVTSYGYTGDAYGGPKAKASLVGAWDNQLSEEALAVSPDIESKFREAGIKPLDHVTMTLADGRTVTRRWEDRTATDSQAKALGLKPLRGRFDFRAKASGLDPHDNSSVLSFEKLTKSTKSTASAASTKFTPPPLDALEIEAPADPPKVLGSPFTPPPLASLEPAAPPELLTREQFGAKRKADITKPIGDKLSSLADGVGEGVRGVVSTVSSAADEFAATPGATKRVPATLLEGLARGTYDMVDLGRRVSGSPAVQIARTLMQPSRLVTDPGSIPNAVGSVIHPAAESTLDQEYARYLEDQQWEQQRAQGLDNQGNLLPQIAGAPLPKTAEVASLVLDPSLAIPAAGVGGKIAKLGERMLARGAVPVAHAVETGARAVESGIVRAGERVIGAVESAGVSPAAARAAAGTVGAGGLLTAPGQAIAATAAGAKGAELGAQAVGALAEEALQPLSQLSITERIARDTARPPWLRKAANAISAVPEPIRRAPVSLISGAATGSLLGGALAVASGADAEGVGRGFGSGGMMGAAGGLLGDFLPGKREAQRRAQQDGDIARTIAHQEQLGGDAERLSRLPRPQLVQIASLHRMIGDSTDIVFVPASDFPATSATSARAAGVFIDQHPESGRARIVVNLDAVAAPGRALTHEISHALLRSPAINKDEVRLAVSGLYGDKGLDGMGREYALRLLQAERQQVPPPLPPQNRPVANAGLLASLGLPMPDKVPPPLDPRRISPADVTLRFNELTQNAINAGDIDGRDWIRDEVFSEHFASELDGKGLTLDHIRRGVAPGADTSRLQESLLAARGTILSALGVTFDQTGRTTRPTSTIFVDNPLMRDPGMNRLVSRMSRDRLNWLTGLAKRGEAPDTPRGAPLLANGNVQRLGDSPAIQWRPNPDGFHETDFAIRTRDGKVILRDPKDIVRQETDRATQARGMVPAQMLPSDSPLFGRKKVDGVDVIAGPTLPPLFDHLSKFSPEIRDAARLMEQSHGTGATFDLWYHQIGSGADGSWAAAVRKNLGNVSATQRELSHIGWEMTKKGNIIGRMLDVGAARARAFELQNQGQLSLWGGAVNPFQRDVAKYLENHAAGIDGATGLGEAKRDFINGFFGATTKVNRARNPLYSGKLGRSLIKTFRLDRMQNVKPTGRAGWAVDYHRIKHNLLPDAPIQ